MLMECDSGAQCSFFRTFEFYSSASKQFDPPLMESDWYALVSRHLEIVLADEIQGTGEIVRKAKNGVRRHGMRSTVSVFYFFER